MEEKDTSLDFIATVQRRVIDFWFFSFRKSNMKLGLKRLIKNGEWDKMPVLYNDNSPQKFFLSIVFAK